MVFKSSRIVQVVTADMTTSVAMCTYNGEAHLTEQLESIGAQTRLPDELLICDDGSIDNTLQLLEDFAARAPFPVRIHRNEHNLGSTKNFEQAIQMCSGEIVFLADQDDVWREDKVEKILDMFAHSKDVALVFSDAEIVDESTCPVGKLLSKTVRFGHSRQRQITRGEAFVALVRRNAVTGATMAVRKSYMDAAYPFPREWVHDGWIALCLSTVGEIALTRECLVKYRHHAHQQVGAEVGLREEVEGARGRNADFWFSEANNYDVARRRLEERDPVAHAQHIRILREKVTHFRRRGKIAARDTWLWPFCLTSEVLRGRYFRYSSGGYKSILNDIFLKRR